MPDSGPIKITKQIAEGKPIETDTTGSQGQRHETRHAGQYRL